MRKAQIETTNIPADSSSNWAMQICVQQLAAEEKACPPVKALPKAPLNLSRVPDLKFPSIDWKAGWTSWNTKRRV